MKNNEGITNLVKELRMLEIKVMNILNNFKD
jgi:hypothetical protein